MCVLNWQKKIIIQAPCGFTCLKWWHPATSSKILFKSNANTKLDLVSSPKLTVDSTFSADAWACSRNSRVKVDFLFIFTTQCHNNLVINHLDIPLCRCRKVMCLNVFLFWFFFLLLGQNVFMHWSLKGKKKIPPCRSFLVSWTKRQLFYAL